MRPAHEVPTPASCARVRTVAVLGAGIAGLTAAHELVQRGFDVTVYEPRADERVALDAAPGGVAPPIKLGGLAASQYARCNPSLDGSAGRLRPFPGRRGRPRPPRGVVAGEHGFRFFPAYYLHIWDMLQRIPVYEAVDRSPDGAVSWRPTARTVMDNVRRVVTQATTVAGKPSLIFPHDSVRSLAELLTLFDQFGDLGFSASDVQTFSGRLLRYLVTSPLRRASELQNLSAYDFFIGRDATAARRYNYTPQFEALIFDMPKVLAAFDSRWGDARTNITTYLQLQMQMDRHDSKVDGVLNAPTTESWFDHWYHHLDALGVRFVRTAVDRIDSPGIVEELPPHLGPRVTVVLTDGTRLAPDYVVSAVDGPTAERITATLRAAGTRGTVAGLDGFATSVPPPRNPLQPAATRPSTRRDPYALERLGRVPWDRFQTLAGIQYYFDTEFQLVHGHVYYTGTEWGISSINQHGLWGRRPDLARDGYVAVLSVDIGDFNTPSRHLLDEQGRGKAARDCPADELAAEVWRQIVAELTGAVHNVPEAILPWPVWYTLDRNLVTDDSGRPIRNEAPYLVPIVGDWPNRPGADPWNPHGSSWGTRPTEDRWLDDLHRGAVWQARHGGYQVHHNSLVFAGTWTKTFTRMTTMEAACESARHAVNAILDHYIWAATGGADRRETTSLSWRFPFGFLDQGFSSPVRFPSPAGDYCFVFDIENREPLDTRTLRDVDSDFCEARLPHPLDTTPQDPVPPSLPTIAGGAPMTSPPSDYTGQLLTYLQTWRQSLEQATAAARPWPTPPPPTPQTPGSSALTPPPLPAPPLAPPAWQAPPLGGGLPLPGLVTAPPVPAGPGQPAPPGPPVPPVATPARPPDDNQPALSPTSTPSDGDNGWATAAIGVHRSRAYSLFSAHLATTPSAAVTDRPTRSAYPWTGATGGTRARPSAPGSSLFGRPELDVAVAPLRLARTDPIASDATDVVTLAPGPPPLEVIRPRAITPISLNEPIAWPRPPASTQPDRGRHSDPSARDGARLSPTAEVPRV